MSSTVTRLIAVRRITGELAGITEPVVVMAPAHYRDLLNVMRCACRGAVETLEI